MFQMWKLHKWQNALFAFLGILGRTRGCSLYELHEAVQS
jgi:hypothetical protein